MVLIVQISIAYASEADVFNVAMLAIRQLKAIEEIGADVIRKLANKE